MRLDSVCKFFAGKQKQSVYDGRMRVFVSSNFTKLYTKFLQGFFLQKSLQKPKSQISPNINLTIAFKVYELSAEWRNSNRSPRMFDPEKRHLKLWISTGIQKQTHIFIFWKSKFRLIYLIVHRNYRNTMDISYLLLELNNTLYLASWPKSQNTHHQTRALIGIPVKYRNFHRNSLN